MGWQGEGLDMLTSLCCDGALLAPTLFLNSELAGGAVTELWASGYVGADNESVTGMDTEDEVVG